MTSIPHNSSASSATPLRSGGSIARADVIDGLVKGMAVLESFDTERQRLNATQAAQRAGITRASARRHLLTLAHLGYLEGEGGYYWLAPKVLRFGGSYLASARLPRVLQPTLNRLAACSRESFSAVVLDRDEVVIVARSPGVGAQGLMAYGLHLGARLPAHATSTGRVLLAAMPVRAFNTWLKGRELPRLTRNTLVEPAALRAAVALARAQDHAWVSEEHELGVHALAVPLRNVQGHTVAALNAVVNAVASAQHRDAQHLRQELLALLQDAARELRHLL